MLGFDAIGRLPIGTVPERTAVTYTLPAQSGLFALSGSATTFNLNEMTAGGAYTLSGSAATFKASLGTLAGSFAETGNPVTFNIATLLLGGSYTLSGSAATFQINEVTGAGAYVFTGFNANEIILEAASSSGYIVTGYPASFYRDFVNWLPGHFLTGSWAVITPPSPIIISNNIPFSGYDGLLSGRYALGQISQETSTTSDRWLPVKAQVNVWTVDPAQQILPPVTG